MKLYFKQRFFTWFDSYDIYDADENTLYTVEGQLAWGHCLKIFDAAGNEVGCVKQRVLTFLPCFEIYGENDTYLGCIQKEFSLLVNQEQVKHCLLVQLQVKVMYHFWK